MSTLPTLTVEEAKMRYDLARELVKKSERDCVTPQNWAFLSGALGDAARMAFCVSKALEKEQPKEP